jgi:dipeptidase D
VQCLTRSSVETSKFDLANALRSAFELMGCGGVFRSVSWMSKCAIRNFRCFVPIYEKQNGDKPRVVACHGSRMWNIRNELS